MQSFYFTATRVRLSLASIPMYIYTYTCSSGFQPFFFIKVKLKNICQSKRDEFGWLIELSCSISGNGIVQYSCFFFLFFVVLPSNCRHSCYFCHLVRRLFALERASFVFWPGLIWFLRMVHLQILRTLSPPSLTVAMFFLRDKQEKMFRLSYFQHIGVVF